MQKLIKGLLHVITGTQIGFNLHEKSFGAQHRRELSLSLWARTNFVFLISSFMAFVVCGLIISTLCCSHFCTNLFNKIKGKGFKLKIKENY